MYLLLLRPTQSAGWGPTTSRYDTGRLSLSTAPPPTDRRHRLTPTEERRRRLSTVLTLSLIPPMSSYSSF